MDILKVDKTKLKTVTNYAKELGLTRQQIYNQIRDKKLKEVLIDGVKFIQL